METFSNAQTQAPPNVFIIRIVQLYQIITNRISLVDTYENMLLHEQIFVNILRVRSNFK